MYVYVFIYRTANEPIGRALCFGDGITQSQWYPEDNCGPFRNVTDILTDIAQVFKIFLFIFRSLKRGFVITFICSAFVFSML